MTKPWSRGWLLAGVFASTCGLAQTHKVAKPETVVRAVGVYEWTGDMAKPAASRLIPVTIYIDQHLEDADVYLARPVPFALETGNVYELEQAGVPKGNLDLAFARHLQAASNAEAYDDGWFGYGTFKSLPVPKKTVARKATSARTAGIQTASSTGDTEKPHFSNGSTKTTTDASTDKPANDPATSNASPVAQTTADPDRPTMKRRSDHGADASTTASTDSTNGAPTDDPDRPTMKRRTDSTAETTSSSGGSAVPADDPDRPTMKRRSDSGGTDSASSGTSRENPAPADDPDRPTLKRRSAADAKQAKAEAGSSADGAVASLNDDPDRPNLHRGKPAHAMTDADLPKLSGLPVDVRQMVAVSDAANRPVHDFSRAWEDDAERAAVLGKMEAIAQAQLAAYTAATAPAAQVPNKPAVLSNSKRRAVNPVRIVNTPLLDEELKGYLLSYGDVPTFVYQAHTAGIGAELRYVTIVAQRDAQGEPKMVLHSVTDAAHLDRAARLRLVDAVDLEASNRASLLFEMRGQTSRQFGVYRILGLQAEQIFSTGTTQ